jgi:hypothetical protein
MNKLKNSSISTWVFDNFGSKEFLANLVVPTGESNVKMVRLSKNYPVMRRIAVKNQLVALSKHEKTSTKTIIRDLIKAIFTDPRELSDCKAEILMKNFPITEACRGKTNNLLPCDRFETYSSQSFKISW